MAKVLDFGIAKAATQDEATRTGMLKGKLAYMAPEQFYPDPVDRRADLWSMGVLLWEMVTGRRLFKGANDAVTYQNIVSAEVPPVARYRPDAPAGDRRGHRRRPRARPRPRYPDAEAMRRALESVLRDEFGAPSRADVADVMREHFGDIVEENRALAVDTGVSAEIKTLRDAPIATGGGRRRRRLGRAHELRRGRRERHRADLAR
jgi:serine/threonine protein kinase